LKGLANIGSPKDDIQDEDESPDENLYPGLEAAAISIFESLSSKKRLDNGVEKYSSGRIIFLTSLDNDKECKPIAAKMVEIQERCDPNSECHVDFVIVNTSNCTEKMAKEKTQVSESLDTVIMNFRPHSLPNRMIMLAKQHFNLRSTSITGIPMKEEQHAGSSANYDVEIIHPAEVHHETNWFSPNIEGQGVGLSSGNKKDPVPRNVITLKWCTPKSSSSTELLQCIGAYRCTPAEVNSRPAACLISFLQQGRTVLLEQPTSAGAKVISHMLVSHGGDVYIHVLATGRNPVEDPPSISEGCGGRVTDYRIEDFGKFMKENRLAPAASGVKSDNESPIKQALNRLERSTRHWPMTISETLIFNMSSHLDTLLNNLVKPRLTDEDIQDCKKVIYKLQAMESRNDTLPLPMISMRGKGSKRDEQYRQLWAELDTFISEAARTSSSHAKVLDCLRGSLDNQSGFGSSANSGSYSSNKDTKQENSVQDMAWREFDKYSEMTEHEKKIINQAPSDPRRRRKNSEPSEENSAVKKKATNSGSPKAASISFKSSFAPKSSLFAIWTNQLKSVADRRHEEFEGRKSSIDGKAELYQELNKEKNNLSSLNTTSVSEWL